MLAEISPDALSRRRRRISPSSSSQYCCDRPRPQRRVTVNYRADTLLRGRHRWRVRIEEFDLRVRAGSAPPTRLALSGARTRCRGRIAVVVVSHNNFRATGDDKKFMAGFYRSQPGLRSGSPARRPAGRPRPAHIGRNRRRGGNNYRRHYECDCHRRHMAIAVNGCNLD